MRWYSKRLAWRGPSNAIHERLEHRRACTSEPLIDLTLSNPTLVGLTCDPERLFRAVSKAENTVYAPSGAGSLLARQAIADELAIVCSADDILLTASSSESYGFIFKLLGDPGDEIAIPKPSYPLLEHLIALEGLVPVDYRLRYAGGAWQIDFDSLKRACSTRTRAIVLVNPNNPTGNYVDESAVRSITELCGNEIPLIVDEVFCSYAFDKAQGERSIVRMGEVTNRAFVLNGWSKYCGLPQLKLGWIALVGCDRDWKRESASALALMADMILSVNSIAQNGAAELFVIGTDVRQQIQHRITCNLNYLKQAVRRGNGSPCTLLPVEGGWTAIIQYPAVIDDETMVLRLMEEEALYLHPGYFYDFDRDGYLVVSLLAREVDFREGIDRLLRFSEKLVHP